MKEKKSDELKSGGVEGGRSGTDEERRSERASQLPHMYTYPPTNTSTVHPSLTHTSSLVPET